MSSKRTSTGDSGYRVTSIAFPARVKSASEEAIQSFESIWNEAGYDDKERQGQLGR